MFFVFKFFAIVRTTHRTFMYGRLRCTHLVVLSWKVLLKTCHVRMQISRDRDLLTPNGWHRALRRFIPHGNDSLLQWSRSFIRKLRLADCWVDECQNSATKWLKTGSLLCFFVLPFYLWVMFFDLFDILPPCTISTASRCMAFLSLACVCVCVYGIFLPKLRHGSDAKKTYQIAFLRNCSHLSYLRKTVPATVCEHEQSFIKISP